MKVSTSQLEEKLIKILKMQQRQDVSLLLFKELSEKARKYKDIIEFLKDDDIDKYLKTEEAELDNELLRKHTGN